MEPSEISIKRLLELETLHTVAQVLGGQRKDMDEPGQRYGRHDLDVILSGGRIAAGRFLTARRPDEAPVAGGCRR